MGCNATNAMEWVKKCKKGREGERERRRKRYREKGGNDIKKERKSKDENNFLKATIYSSFYKPKTSLIVLTKPIKRRFG